MTDIKSINILPDDIPDDIPDEAAYIWLIL